MKRFLAIGALLAFPAAAAELVLPQGARLLSERETGLGSYALPLGPAAAEGVPARAVEGRILRRTWQIRGASTVLQALAPLREQIGDQGLEILFQCEAQQCGGFDFRFGIEVVPAPDMAVNISDYHFLSAAKGDRAVSVLVSRSGNAAYVQIIEVLPPEAMPLAAPSAVAAPAESPAAAENSLAEQLQASGRVILSGLDFGTGAARLAEGSHQSLAELAAFLSGHPDAAILLVGHTDSVGSLEDNIALSRARAAAVRDRLASAHGVEPERVDVAGAGYMAPLTTNLTEDGREANRRVEAVLVSN
ncbi:OmpA family protein [Roseobacteraceae bacterium NS-SX3]